MLVKRMAAYPSIKNKNGYAIGLLLNHGFLFQFFHYLFLFVFVNKTNVDLISFNLTKD